MPLVAKEIGLYEKIDAMTKRAMIGKESFSENFKSRVDMLKGISLSKIQKAVKEAKLNEYIVKFIKENRQRCLIITGNLDIVVLPILKELGMEDRCYCCKAEIREEALFGVLDIIDKKEVVEKFDFPFVAIGDGANDIDMIKMADIGIGFGKKESLPKELIENANYIFDDDKNLYEFLNSLLEV